MLYKVNKNLEFKKMPWYYKLYKVSFLFNLGLILIFIHGSFTPIIITETVVKYDTINLIKNNDINLVDKDITLELIEIGCVLPNVALAQMKIETGHFKSDICKENKNIAGIRTSTSKYVKRDKNGKIIKNRGHNVYNTYKDCLKDYVSIQNKYLKNINGKYAEAPGYVDLIKNIK
jgi:hypothetical protein